ncbi:ATP synthase subunit b [Bienertia sinuspersici]
MSGIWLTVHYNHEGYDIQVRDIDEYSFLCLLQDLDERAYLQNMIPARNPVIRYYHPGLKTLIEVNSDLDLSRMFGVFSRKKEIDIYVENSEKPSKGVEMFHRLKESREKAKQKLAEKERLSKVAEDIVPLSKEVPIYTVEKGGRIGAAEYFVVDVQTGRPVNKSPRKFGPSVGATGPSSDNGPTTDNEPTFNQQHVPHSPSTTQKRTAKKLTPIRKPRSTNTEPPTPAPKQPSPQPQTQPTPPDASDFEPYTQPPQPQYAPSRRLPKTTAKRLGVFQAKAKQPRVVEEETNIGDDIGEGANNPGCSSVNVEQQDSTWARKDNADVQNSADPVPDLDDQHYDPNQLHSFPLTDDDYGESEEQLIQAVKDFSIQEGADLVRIKVDSTRLEHNPLAGIKWCVAKLMEDVRANFEVPIKTLIQVCLDRYGVSVPKSTMYKARTEAAKFSGPFFEMYFWQAADAFNEFVFKKAMEKIHKLSAEAYQYLMNIDLSLWARFKFDPNVSCSDNTNNFTESWNATLGLDRVRPIMGLLEAIRRSCMVRIGNRQALCQSWESQDVTPYAKEQIRKISEEARTCQLYVSGNGKYEVVEGKTTFPIDLVQMKCMCGKWQISGIPCKHALRVINNSRLNPYTYVNDYYSVHKYKQAYALSIQPMPDPSQWQPRETPNIHPPEVKRTVGRPPRNRRREPGEQPKGKRSVAVKCSKCGEMGHNKRACMGGLTATQKKATGAEKNKKKGREEGISTHLDADVTGNKGRKAKKAKKA